MTVWVFRQAASLNGVQSLPASGGAGLLGGAARLQHLPQLSESAEEDDPDVGLAEAHDLGDLAVRELGVELQGDDVLLSSREVLETLDDGRHLLAHEDL